MADVQDDEREIEMRRIAGLQKKGGRSDEDAHLCEIEDHDDVPFELKSSTNDSVSTGRDIGHEHLRRWNELDWLVGFYLDDDGDLVLNELYHFQPGELDWFGEKEDYIEPDYELLAIAAENLDDDAVSRIFGDEESYGYDDVKRVLKQQKMYPSGERLKKAMIEEMADLPGTRFSRERLLEILRHRVRYLIHRGGTLNNPHIPKKSIVEVAHKFDLRKDDIPALLRERVLNRLNAEEE